ncbi:MAG TPA: PepSY-associated TM helix domain-containing protein [Noviherbaspirillum sp.]|nr:PepSY-associated TM helix domain-containing protein [Noviherbaspirillum sp.]
MLTRFRLAPVFFAALLASGATQARSIDHAPGHAVPAAARRKRSRRAVFLTWLRKTHLYVGLWGAVLGLLFGASGILMNHRAIMKIPVEKAVQRTAQLPLPEQGFASPKELAAWLQKELHFPATQPPIVKTQPSRTVMWEEREVRQPERWSISLARPDRGVMAEYFVGNRSVKLDHVDATPIGTLTRLHMSTGVGAFWVLLSDTIAGSLILLSITGLLLWTQLHTVRTVAVLTSCGALAAATWFLWSI